MSIRTFIALGLAAISFLLAIPVLILVADSWQARQSADIAGKLVEMLGGSTVIAETIAPERGATNLAIADDSPAARKTMMDSRAKTDLALQQMDQILANARIPEAIKVAADVAEIRAGLARIRNDAETDIASHDRARLAANQARFFAAMAVQNEAIGQIGATIQRKLIERDAAVASISSAALLSWNVRDYAGRLSAAYIQMMAIDQPISPEMLHQTDLYQGRSDQAWDMIRNIAAAPESPRELRDVFARVEESYQTPFRAIQSKVITDRAAGRREMDATMWRKATQPMMQSIMQIRDVALAAAHQETDQKKLRANRNLALMSCLTLLSIGLMVAITMTMTRRVSRPLGELTDVISELADGGRNIHIPHANRRDEMGALARAIAILLGNAREADLLAASQRAEHERKESERERLATLVQSFLGEIDQVVVAVASTADKVHSETSLVAESAATAAQQARVVTSAAQQATGNVQTVAAAAEELSGSIQEIARQVAEAATISVGAVQQAETTSATISSLSQMAEKIGDVIQLITDIASQTNLLALNATIEAARAGEAGKGFAVVAGEVKALAQQTARATDEIQNQVGAIRQETERAVGAIGAIGQTIGQVNQITMGIASAVEQQGAATGEIARNVQQAASGTIEVSSSISQVTIATDRTGQVAARLSAMADGLTHESGQLKRVVGDFIGKIGQ